MSVNSQHIKSVSLTINLWVLLVGLFLGTTGVTSAFGDDDENCATSHFYLLENASEGDADQGGEDDDESSFLGSTFVFESTNSLYNVAFNQLRTHAICRVSIPLYLLFHSLRFDGTVS